MKKYLKGRKIDITTKDSQYKGYYYLKMDEIGIWIKKTRRGYFIPWHNIEKIQFAFISRQMSEVSILQVGNSVLELLSNKDIFEDPKIDDKTKSLLQLKVIFINNRLFNSATKANLELKKVKFPIKINGRDIQDLQELTINEKMFLGLV